MTIRLTQLSGGGGCGCKLPPLLLRELLAQARINESPPADLLVGALHNDDAAVWKLSDDNAVVATADFFSPVVDSPRDFGKIAAANAISDVYAMGARPLFALALAAMPKTLPPAIVSEIFTGGRETCLRAGAVIAGGHSIEAKEPLYGLAVVGGVHPDRLLTNGGAQSGDVLILGKPLGIGVLSAALRRETLSAAEYAEMLAVTTQLNTAGETLARLAGVHALTDVTGFGLLGHLLEMCRAAGLSATINIADLPFLPAAVEHARRGVMTGASTRNWESVNAAVRVETALEEWQQTLLTDPQTSGGLLLSCAATATADALAAFKEHGQNAAVIGNIGNIGNGDGDNNGDGDARIAVR